MKHSALKYAELACEAIMHTYAPQELPPKNSLFYHQGVFLSGMERVYKLTGDKKYFNYIKDYIDSVIGPNGELYGICHELEQPKDSYFNKVSLTMLDCKQPGILLFNLFDETGDEKYMNAVKTLGESMYYWPVNEYGGYWHMMMQHNQMWMDGAYMIGPLSVMYAKRFGDNTLRERAIKQVFIMNEHIKDEKTGLYFHGWDPTKQAPWADKETGLSQNIWGRAVGWYAVAMLDILEYIPEDHPDAERIKQIERDLLESLVKYQDPETGMWYEVLDKPGKEGNWVESSCTNLFIYSYAKAMRMGIIDEATYRPVLEKAYEGSTNTLYYDEEGYLVVDHVCIGTCIETGTYEFYCQRQQIKNDLHGMGAFVLMCTEMEKWERRFK